MNPDPAGPKHPSGPTSPPGPPPEGGSPPGPGTGPGPERAGWRLGPVGESVVAQIAKLQVGYIKDRPDAVAALARIRRGAGHSFGELPDLWGLFAMDRVYDEVRGETDTIRAENAVHLAITLWARHQQSHRTKGMHRPGGSELGAAVRLLMPGTDIDEPVRQRFVRAGSATSFEILAQRLGELVLLLRRHEIALDYGLLAAQLYAWQRPGGDDRVRRSWGRSFHIRPKARPEQGPDGSRSSDSPTENPSDGPTGMPSTPSTTTPATDKESE
ncbi:type I-E CRISPR-associated protein Cse2/CasB [Streptodolium elevatio]